MTTNLFQAFTRNFLGNSSQWYKTTIMAFLIVNPVIWFAGY
ncbi:MAG TPA: hypothetical protein ENJ35_07565, partial [Gammaproteobacteria bacterium]|nr:hypothetical protein [Gammaproteobacteria bacterium]